MSTYYKVTLGFQNLASGCLDYLWLPNARNRISNTLGIVLMHGAGEPDEYINPSYPGSVSLAGMLAHAGFPVVSVGFNAMPWGNDFAISAMTNGISYLHNVAGTSATRAHVMGVSMGSFTAFRYAAANTSKVASCTGLLQLGSLINFYNDNVGNNQVGIATAWGVAAPAALPSGANIIANSTSMKNVVPSRIYYSSADTAAYPADALALATAAGSSTVNVGLNGHSENSIVDACNVGAGEWTDLISFVSAHNA